jgi:hypothetical protein
MLFKNFFLKIIHLQNLVTFDWWHHKDVNQWIRQPWYSCPPLIRSSLLKKCPYKRGGFSWRNGLCVRFTILTISSRILCLKKPNNMCSFVLKITKIQEGHQFQLWLSLIHICKKCNYSSVCTKNPIGNVWNTIWDMISVYTSNIISQIWSVRIDWKHFLFLFLWKTFKRKASWKV